MKYAISQALKAAGYTEDQPTVENLINCFLDYMDAYNNDIEEVREEIKDGTITVEMMCRALVRCK